MASSTPTKPKPTKPPKDEWPTFILDLGTQPKDRWTIRKFEDCEKDFWDDNIGWTYSAISYAWGYWHDKGSPKATRPTFEWHDSKDPAYPAFDPKITPTWLFPVMNKNYKAPFQFQDPPDPIFTIEDIRRTLKALGTRYVWWDWACVPQGLPGDLKAMALPNAQPAPSPQTLLDLQTLEVDKMRTVYACSLNGCLWLHQTTWVRDTKSIKGAVQLVLEHIISMRTAGFQKLTFDVVEAFYGLLLAAQNTQNSLTSVWSLQEGILFGDDNRPQVGPTSKFPSGSTTCLILDHNGEAFGSHTDGLVGGQGDYVQDIVATASRIVGIIANVLVAKANSVGLGSGASPFEQWCYSEEAKSRDLLSRLIGEQFIYSLECQTSL
jgi:hypothetical protein